jgi:copper chaperone CopZ
VQTEVLEVTGMTGSSCTSTVMHALKAIRGVVNVNVSLVAGTATVHYEEQQTSPEHLDWAVTNAGYGVHITMPPTIMVRSQVGGSN